MNELIQTQSNQRKTIKYKKCAFESNESFIAQLEDQIAIINEIINEMYDEYKLTTCKTYTITDKKNGKYTVKLSEPPPLPPAKDTLDEGNNNNGIINEFTNDEEKIIWNLLNERNEQCVTLKADFLKCKSCVGMGRPCHHIFVVVRKCKIKKGIESVNLSFRLSQEGLNWIKINRKS